MAGDTVICLLLEIKNRLSVKHATRTARQRAYPTPHIIAKMILDTKSNETKIHPWHLSLFQMPRMRLKHCGLISLDSYPPLLSVDFTSKYSALNICLFSRQRKKSTVIAFRLKQSEMI